MTTLKKNYTAILKVRNIGTKKLLIMTNMNVVIFSRFAKTQLL